MGRGDPRRARHPQPAGAWRRSTAARSAPARRSTTDDEILDWVRRDGETALHPSCTARMGVDAMSVTDPLTMGVHGVDGLRVVDASAMPYVTNGNIYAPVMMLAEKAADLILGNTPLAPEPSTSTAHDVCRDAAVDRRRVATLGRRHARDPLPGRRQRWSRPSTRRARPTVDAAVAAARAAFDDGPWPRTPEVDRGRGCRRARPT